MALVTDLKAVMALHGIAAIAALPVTIVFGEEPDEVQVLASFRTSAAGQGITAVDGGPVYLRGGTVYLSKADLPTTLKENDLLRMVMEDASLRTFEVFFIGGGENPTATEVWLDIGPPNK